MKSSRKSSRRILAVSLTAACAAPLAACSPLDFFGPHANSEIMALAKQASADKASGDDAWRDLRAFHAEQLKEEARRLCGTDETGTLPSTCDVGYGDTDLPASGDIAELVARTAKAADKVPEDSVDLVVAQAIDAVAATGEPLDLISTDAPIDDADALESAQQLAKAEYAVDYGLDIASAYGDNQLQGRIDRLRPLHDARLSSLHDAFPAGALPAREAGYEIPGEAPTSPAEAAAFVDKLERDLVELWRTAAADATSVDWRTAAIILAGHAQRAAETA